MKKKEKWTECFVCQLELTYGNANNYLDPRNGKISTLCDKHLEQAMEMDEKQYDAKAILAKRKGEER